MERMNDMENKAKISVFGAGKMGTGIALQFAVTGFPVKLLAFDVRVYFSSCFKKFHTLGIKFSPNMLLGT